MGRNEYICTQEKEFSMDKKQNIKELSYQELSEYLSSIGEPAFRAKQLWQWLWQKNVTGFDQMTNLSKKLRARLKEDFVFEPVEIYSYQQSPTDQTIKYTFRLKGNHLVEGVLIPSRSSERVTACISTQVGCPLGCKFCATGTMGLKRNLHAYEIYDHLWLLNQQSQKHFGRKLTNIVVMGMGEPLLNLDNVLLALDIITSDQGLGMSPQRITLSTVGMVKELYRLADMKPKFNLAVSLHSAIDEVRSGIMPVNKSNPLPDLVKALKYFHKQTGKRITFEYLMLAGVNDSIKDAKALADFTRNFPSKINLIEYNETPHSIFRKSPPERVREFVNFLENRNLVVTVRRSKGSDIAAACGQLVKITDRNKQLFNFDHLKPENKNIS